MFNYSLIRNFDCKNKTELKNQVLDNKELKSCINSYPKMKSYINQLNSEVESLNFLKDNLNNENVNLGELIYHFANVYKWDYANTIDNFAKETFNNKCKQCFLIYNNNNNTFELSESAKEGCVTFLAVADLDLQLKNNLTLNELKQLLRQEKLMITKTIKITNLKDIKFEDFTTQYFLHNTVNRISFISVIDGLKKEQLKLIARRKFYTKMFNYIKGYISLDRVKKDLELTKQVKDIVKKNFITSYIVYLEKDNLQVKDKSKLFE